MRSPARAQVSDRRAADRGELRSRRGRRRHQRACGGVVLPARRAERAHPDPRQSRRFRRPRQAQRVHARWPPHHRLWRQPVDAIAEDALQRGRQGAAARSRRRRRRGSRPRSSASSIRRSACRAACSSRARRSAAMCWWPATRRAGDDDDSAAAPTPSRCAEFIAAFPVSDASKAQLLALYDGARDPLAGKSVDEKRAILKRTSYRDYLTKICGCSEEVANCFQGRTLGFLRARLRRGAGGRRARHRLSGLRRAEAADDTNAGLERALHLSFPRRQRVARAAAGARAHSRHRAGRHDGRRRAGAVRLRASSTRRPAGPHPARLRPASMCATPATRRRSPTCATARCIASRRAMRCSPAST